MSGGSPDRRVVDAVLAGDDEAFRMLVERESPQLIALCRRMLGDAYEAEDVAQEAFLRAYRSLPTYRGDGPFGAWVWRIAMRLSVARLRQRPTHLQADPTRAEGWLEPTSTVGEPLTVALGDEQRREMLEAIDSLPPAQRQVVRLRFYGDLSMEEISTSTGAPVGTVKSRLHRALGSLRGHMGPRS